MTNVFKENFFVKTFERIKKKLETKRKDFWEYRNVHFITDFELMMCSMNSILTLTFIVYIGLLLNLKFTNQFFKVADYQCYDSTLYMGLGEFWTNQFFPDWWVFLSDIAYFIVPVYQNFVLVLYRKSSNNTGDIKTSNYLLLGTLLFFKLLTFFWRVYQTIYCYYFQFCRICNSTCKPKFNCSPNSLWIIILTWNVFWILIMIIYGIIIIAGFYENNLKSYREQQMYNLELNKFYSEVGIPYDGTVKNNYPMEEQEKISYFKNVQTLRNDVYYKKNILQ